jgi:hypothetical protein
MEGLRLLGSFLPSPQCRGHETPPERWNERQEHQDDIASWGLRCPGTGMDAVVGQADRTVMRLVEADVKREPRLKAAGVLPRDVLVRGVRFVREPEPPVLDVRDDLDAEGRAGGRPNVQEKALPSSGGSERNCRERRHGGGGCEFALPKGPAASGSGRSVNSPGMPDGRRKAPFGELPSVLGTRRPLCRGHVAGPPVMGRVFGPQDGVPGQSRYDRTHPAMSGTAPVEEFVCWTSAQQHGDPQTKPKPDPWVERAFGEGVEGDAERACD